MKKGVIFLMFILLIINVNAKEVAIPGIFEASESFSQEVYFYSGADLIASFDESLNYVYNDKLGSNFESKNLPFGQLTFIKNRFSFTGKELDQELYYFSARYYDSELGRFISIDPIEENHPYSYVRNNPLNLIDPDGMRIKIHGSREDRATIQRDLDIMVGAGNAIIEEAEEGYFISIVNNYQGEFPRSFALLKDVVEHPTTILLRVTGDTPGSKPQLVERSQTIPIGEDNPIYPSDNYKFVDSLGENMFIEDIVTKESIQELFDREAKYIVTQTSRSGMPEVYYSGEDVKDETFKIKYKPYEILAHELMGHALSYIKGEEYSDIPFSYVMDDPHAAGPGVYAQNIVRQEHGEKIRPAY